MTGQDLQQSETEMERLRRRVSELEQLALERTEHEQQVKRTEEYVRLLVTYMPASVALLDRDMRYILTSSRWMEDYGLANRDIIGLSHYEVFPEVPERWKEIHRRCLAGANERCDEDPFPRADGRMDWIRWQVFPWHEKTGEIGGIMMFTEVITKHKELQAQVQAQSAALRELSTPIIPISDKVLVLPLIGSVDQQRASQLTDELLTKIVEQRAQICIIDVTGVPVVDTMAASSLLRIAKAVRLLGAEVVLTGIRPEVAQALVGLDVDVSSIVTRRDLQNGIAFAMTRR
jgi:rsbT co-antagonist protein RsbR